MNYEFSHTRNVETRHALSNRELCVMNYFESNHHVETRHALSHCELRIMGYDFFAIQNLYHNLGQ